MITQFATLLTEEQVERGHAASLDVLENVGLLVRNEKARKRRVKQGCHLDLKTDIVKFPLPAIFFSVSTLADDAPPGHFSLSRYYPALKNCLKPVRGNVPDVSDAQSILKLGFLVAGSEAAYQASSPHHPSLLRGSITPNPGLRLDGVADVLDQK